MPCPHLETFFTNVAILIFVNRYYNGSGMAITGVYLSLFLPLVLMIPISGAIKNLIEQRKLMLMSALLRAALVLLFLIVSLVDNKRVYWMIYPILALVSFSNALYIPCYQSIVMIVGEDKPTLIPACMLDSIIWISCMFFGSAMGGFITASIGPTANFIIDSVIFLFCAFFILQLLLMQNFYGNEVIQVRPSDIDKDIRMGGVHKDYDVESNEDSDIMTTTSTTSHHSSASHVSRTEHVISLRREGLTINTNIDITPLDDSNASKTYSNSAKFKMEIKNYMKDILTSMLFLLDNKYLFSLCIFKSSCVLIWAGVVEFISLKFSDSFFKIRGDMSMMLAIAKTVAAVGSCVAPLLMERIISISLDRLRQKKSKQMGLEVEYQIWNPQIIRTAIVLSILSLLIGTFFVYVSPSIHITLFFIGLLIIGAGASISWSISNIIIFTICPIPLLAQVITLDMTALFSISQIISVASSGIIYDSIHSKNAQPLSLLYIAIGILFALIYNIWWIYFRNKQHDVLALPAPKSTKAIEPTSSSPIVLQ